MTKFGIDLSKGPKLVSWVTKHFETKEFGWRSVFSSVKLARDFVREFEAPVRDVILLGVGLHRELLRLFEKEGSPTQGLLRSGIFEMIDRSPALELGGRSLGYEILCYDYMSFAHSWLCNSLEVDGLEKFGIRPNANGFIDSLEEARRMGEYAGDDNVMAEPGLWLPWLIVEYPMV